jgi:hypothetical protein
MEKNTISTHTDLQSLILLARASKDRQEEDLKESFKKFAHALSPVEITKSTIHQFVKDKDLQFDLVKGGMDIGASYLIEGLFNKRTGLKAFLSTMALKKLSSTFIQANAGNLIIGVTSWLTAENKVD